MMRIWPTSVITRTTAKTLFSKNPSNTLISENASKIVNTTVKIVSSPQRTIVKLAAVKEIEELQEDEDVEKGAVVRKRVTLGPKDSRDE